MLVTAVMPTRNRPKYVARAIRCFFSQTYEPKELVIVDDGLEPSAPVVPSDPRIRYVYAVPGGWATLGQKRNYVNRLAQGEVIMHLDDDDWSAPERMVEQVAVLESGAQVTGYNCLFFYRERDGEMFKYKFTGLGHYAVGTSLCYRKSYWKENEFPSLQLAEDSQFSFKAAGKNALLSVPGWGKMVAVTLSSSTAKPNLGDSNFPSACRAEFPEAFFEALKYE